MKRSTEILLSATIVMAGLGGFCAPATAAEPATITRELATILPAANTPNCVQPIRFESYVGGGKTNTSVLIRNHCPFPLKAKAQVVTNVNGTRTSGWGPCAKINANGGTWSSGLLTTSSVGGSFWNWSGNNRSMAVTVTC